MLLDGKVAAITGGTRGIGRGIAEAFLAEGASVVVSGRSAEKGERALAEMGVGDRARFIAGDVLNQADAEAVPDAAVEAYGRIDILVNNAGGSGGFGLVHELSDEAWNVTADWILNSTFWATRRALQHMVRQGEGGRIINISSVEGKQANKAAVSPYIVFKHALNGFTKAVAFEYGPMGITSNAICPGAIETDLMMEAGPAAAATRGHHLRGVPRQLRPGVDDQAPQHGRGGRGDGGPAGVPRRRRHHQRADERRRRHRGLVGAPVAYSMGGATRSMSSMQ